MLSNKILGVAFSLGSILIGQTSLAQGICGAGAENLRARYGCNADKWEREECYDLGLACGEFATVAANLASESKELTLNQYYWQGMAYYGLLIGTRSTGLRCEYYTQARRSLSHYLQASLNVLTGADLEKKQLKPDPNKVYRVTKVAEELTQVKGCAEDGMTANEISQLAQSTAEASVRDAFLRPNEAQKILMNKVFTEIQGVITNASSVETTIGLKEVAAVTMGSYLEQQILSDWLGTGPDSGIGEAEIVEHKLVADASRAEKLKDTITAPLYAKAVALADALNRAFGGCDADHLPAGLTKPDWNALSDKDREQKCRESAAVLYGQASDFQKKSAREQIGIATLLLEVTQGQNERLLKLFSNFNEDAGKIKGIAPLRPLVNKNAAAWLKVGTTETGFSNVCLDAAAANVDFWFCVPSQRGTGANP
ncbi:MAG: hypothetical protein H7318_14935 [Oligoflexus sp.]|nr:hypothetical protein [Oligoflexus sp.]